MLFEGDWNMLIRGSMSKGESRMNKKRMTMIQGTLALVVFAGYILVLIDGSAATIIVCSLIVVAFILGSVVVFRSYTGG